MNRFKKYYVMNAYYVLHSLYKFIIFTVILTYHKIP